MGRTVVLMAWVMAGRRVGWLEGDAKLVQIAPACGHRSLTVLRKGVVHEVLVAMMALLVMMTGLVSVLLMALWIR